MDLLLLAEGLVALRWEFCFLLMSLAAVQVGVVVGVTQVHVCCFFVLFCFPEWAKEKPRETQFVRSGMAFKAVQR